MIGSEGTLGIVTAAALKLHPRPAATLTAMASLPTLAAAGSICLALAHVHARSRADRLSR